MTRSLHILAAAAIAVVAGGCKTDRQLRSDMAAQPRYDTAQAADPGTFADGASARPLPAGVLARDPASVPGIPYSAVRTDKPALAHEVLPDDAAIPFPVDAAALDRGRTQYDTFCAVCHGRLGNGQGMIVQRGFTPPPSFHVERLRAVPDAHVYNVIANGYGAMFPYNDRVPPQQRWEIVAYVRALQAAPDAAGLPPDDAVRRALIAAGDRPVLDPQTRPSSRPTGGGAASEGGAR